MNFAKSNNNIFFLLLGSLLLFLTLFIDSTSIVYSTRNKTVPFSPMQTISTDAPDTKSVHIADINGDGRQDIVFSARGADEIIWLENIGNGEFRAKQPHNTLPFVEDPYEVTTADIDMDDDLDILVALGYPGKVVWFENLNGNGNFGIQQDVNLIAGEGATFVVAGDIDSDNDQDIVAVYQGGENWINSRIAWYQNENKGANWVEHIILADADRAKAAYLDDIDHDNDLDVLTATAEDNTIAWHENTNGEGEFESRIIVSDQVNFPVSVKTADINGDGKIDIVSSSTDDLKVNWYENMDDNWITHDIVTLVEQPFSFSVVDIDGDGANDIITKSKLGNDITWYQNLAEDGMTWEDHDISSGIGSAWSVQTTDLDHDGDIDVVAALTGEGKIVWWENESPHTLFLPLIKKPLIWEFIGNKPAAVTTYYDVTLCDDVAFVGTDNGLYRLVDNAWIHEGVTTKEVRDIHFLEEDCNKVYLTSRVDDDPNFGEVWFGSNTSGSWIWKKVGSNLNSPRAVVTRGAKVYIGNDFGIWWAMMLDNGEIHDWKNSLPITATVLKLNIQPESPVIFASVWGDGIYSNGSNYTWIKRGEIDPEFAAVVEGIGDEIGEPKIAGTNDDGIFRWNNNNWVHTAPLYTGQTLSVAFINNLYYAGQTGIGVLFSSDGENWFTLNEGLQITQNFTVRQIEFDDSDQMIYIATSDGVWRRPAP